MIMKMIDEVIESLKVCMDVMSLKSRVRNLD